MTGDQPQATVFERGSKVHEYWLAHAEGFHVVSRRKPRDRVDHVVVDREHGSATALVVRRRPGRRPKRIPVVSVLAVDPFERVLYLTPRRPVRSVTERVRLHVVHATASTSHAQRAAAAWLRPRAVAAAGAIRLELVRAALWLRPRLLDAGRLTTAASVRGYHASRTSSRAAYTWVRPRIVALVRRAARAVRSARNRHLPRLAVPIEQLGVRKLLLVGEHLRIRVRGHRKVTLPDVLADSRSRDAGEVEKADPPVPEIVR